MERCGSNRQLDSGGDQEYSFTGFFFYYRHSCNNQE